MSINGSNQLKPDTSNDKKVMLTCSKVQESLHNLDSLCDEAMQSKSLATSLQEVYLEISSTQESIEKNCLFNLGQELYTAWLRLALKYDRSELSKMDGNLDKIPGSGNFKNTIALAYNNRGYMKYLQVDFEGAIQDYTVALEYDSELPSAYYNRGLVTYRLAFFQQAYEDMSHAVKLAPSCDEFKIALQKTTEELNKSPGYPFTLPSDSDV